MKLFIKNAITVAAMAVVLVIASCKKNMDDLFPNPDVFSETKIEYLLSSGIDYSIRQDYVDIYANHLLSIAQITQVLAGTSNSASLYDWTGDMGRWGNYFTKDVGMVGLKGIEQIYNFKLSEAQKEEYKPFLAMAKILMAYNTTRATDLFDDMPYTEAFKGQNSLYNQPAILKPKYDSQQSIYYAVLADLKAAAAILASTKLDTKLYPSTHGALTQQDILFRGDLMKWVKFANSLRLRYAMRISGKDAAKASAELNDLISTNAPLILLNQDNAYLYKGGQVAGAGGGEITQIRAFAELPFQTYAPKLMVDLMTEANDPRLGIFFVKPATAATIVGLSPGRDARTAAGQTDGTIIGKQIATLNTTTFVRNTALPTGTGITAADVNFLLAEASVKGLITGKTFVDATDYYNAGIYRSVEAYYDLYAKSTFTPKDPALTTQPSAALKAALVANPNYIITPTNALNRIATQKWMNTNILQSYETFTEYRRLDLPVLLPDVDAGEQLNSADKIPKRLIIPTSEIGANGTNYALVASKNIKTSKVWWDVN